MPYPNKQNKHKVATQHAESAQPQDLTNLDSKAPRTSSSTRITIKKNPEYQAFPIYPHKSILSTTRLTNLDSEALRTSSSTRITIPKNPEYQAFPVYPHKSILSTTRLTNLDSKAPRTSISTRITIQKNPEYQAFPVYPHKSILSTTKLTNLNSEAPRTSSSTRITTKINTHNPFNLKAKKKDLEEVTHIVTAVWSSLMASHLRTKHLTPPDPKGVAQIPINKILYNL